MRKSWLGGALVVGMTVLGVTTEAQAQTFVRGDVNADGSIDITDCIFLLNFLFLFGFPPPCEDAADVNDDGTLNIADPIYKLAWLFIGAPPPPPPTPSGAVYPKSDCGPDPTADGLGCVAFPPCNC